MGICRLCMRSADMSLYFEDRNVFMQRFLVFFTNLKINKDDGLPQHICLLCLQKLEAIDIFITQCQQSDKALRCDLKPTVNTIYNEFIDDLKSFTIDDENADTKVDKRYPKFLPVVCKKEIPIEYNSEENYNKLSFYSDDDSFDRYFSDDDNKQQKNAKKKSKKIDSNKSDYVCVICDKHIDKSKRYVFIRHMGVHKNYFNKYFKEGKQLPLLEKIDCTCPLCEVRFDGKTQDEFNRHMDVHKAVLEEYFLHPKRRVKVPKKNLTEKSDFLCTICGKCFEGSQRNAFNRHMGIHKIKEYRCEVCNRKFSLKKFFDNHKMQHDTGKLFCTKCNKHFSNLHVHKQHMRYTHDLTEKFTCEICHKDFRRKSAMKIHTKKHSAPHNPKYGCDLCGKMLFTRQALIVHIRGHSGERPYACRYCGKCYGDKRYVLIHERSHTGHTPHKCPVCLKGFTQGGCMRSHFTSNHKEYNFKECIKKYREEQKLKNTSDLHNCL